MCKLGMQWHLVAVGGKARGRNLLEGACIVDLFAAVIYRPWGVGLSFKSGVVLSHRFMVQPVSMAVILEGNTEGLLCRVERVQEEGGLGGE